VCISHSLLTLLQCHSLKNLSDFTVFLEDNSTDYNTFTSAYWSAQQAEVNPYCVVKPSSALQVSTIVLLSRLTNCPFAVKGGGHAAFQGSSSIEGGITVALERLNEVEVAADNQTVFVGPGNRWLEFYTELEKYGLGVVGGRVSFVTYRKTQVSYRWIGQRYRCTRTYVGRRHQLLCKHSRLGMRVSCYSNLFALLAMFVDLKQQCREL
jgi:FAD binding domain